MPDTLAAQTPVIEANAAAQGAAQSSDKPVNLHERIINLKRSGQTQREIALALGISKGTVSWHVDQEVKLTAKELGKRPSTREEIHERIFSLAPRALETVEGLVKSAEKDEVRLKAADSILDRAGFAPVQKIISLSIVEEMSREELISEIKNLISEIIPTEKIIEINFENKINSENNSNNAAHENGNPSIINRESESQNQSDVKHDINDNKNSLGRPWPAQLNLFPSVS